MRTLALPTVVVVLAAACETAAPPAAAIATVAPTKAVSRVAPTRADLALEQGGQALSLDERGVPRFILAAADHPVQAPAGDAEQAARFHLGRFLGAQAVDASALAIAKAAQVRDLGAD